MITNDPKTLKELVAKFETEIFPAYQKARKPFERTWYQNMAFFLGKHYVEWVSSLNRLMEYPSPTWRVKLTANKIFSIVRKLAAKLLATEPQVYVLPGTTEAKSREASKVGRRFLQALWRTQDMPSELRRFCMRGVIYGTAYMIPFFNKQEGETLEPEYDYSEKDGERRVPAFDERGIRIQDQDTDRDLFFNLDKQGNRVVNTLKTGEADFFIPDVTDIYYNPGATDDPKTLKSFFYVRQFETKEVEETYNVKGIESGIQLDNTSMLKMIGFLMDNESATAEKDKNATLVYHYFEAPSQKYPKGFMLVYCKGYPVPLVYEELPPEVLRMRRKLPLITWRMITIPGRFLGMTPAEQAIPLQIQYNKMRSMVIEHCHRMAKGKILVPTQAKVDQTITDEPGQIIRYWAGSYGAPSQMSMANLPAYVFQNIASLSEEIYDVTGLHESSHARPPKGVRAGTAFEVLQEMDNSDLSPSIDALADAIREWGEASLCIAKERYTEPRMLNVVGKNYHYYVKDFSGARLEENAEVVCQIGSALPQSVLARAELYKELFRLGAFKDTPDAKKLLALLEMTGEDLNEEGTLDQSRADIENEEMAAGKVRMVALYDNHVIHEERHTKFMKQPTYDLLTDAVKHIFTLHVAAHNEYMNKGGISMTSKIEMQKALQELLAPPAPVRKK